MTTCSFVCNCTIKNFKYYVRQASIVYIVVCTVHAYLYSYSVNTVLVRTNSIYTNERGSYVRTECSTYCRTTVALLVRHVCTLGIYYLCISMAYVLNVHDQVQKLRTRISTAPDKERARLPTSIVSIVDHHTVLSSRPVLAQP